MSSLRVTAIIFAGWLALTGAGPVLGDGGSTDQPPVRTEMTDDGPILVTSSGMTLYTYSRDDSTPGKSQCSNVPVLDMPDPTSGFGKYPLPGYMFLKSCAATWPPLLADANAQANGDWSLIDRSEGGKQWRYRGRPLYTSIKDHKAGDRNGVLNVQFSQAGWRLAAPPLDLPPGLTIIRDAETLVLATTNGRPVYTPRNQSGVVKASARAQELFEPIAAPSKATIGGEWSITEAGAGRRQYVFQGKRLYEAPASLANREIDESGDWDKVVFRKRTGRPPEIETRFSLIGDNYTDKNGRTLYVFTCTAPGCDDPGGPAGYWSALCRDGKECSRRWRPYLASRGAHSEGEWSVMDVPDPIFTNPTGTIYPPDAPRVKAWAFRGRPVYTYYEDKEPGDVWGHQLRWFALSTFVALQVPGHGVYD